MESVQNTHNSGEFDRLHNTLLAVVGTFNRPQRDAMMIEQAGVTLDRALFPLLVQIGRFGPVGIVELADRVGRDYTTVSRQVAKLEQTGLALRQKNVRDKRINEAVITEAGKQITDRIDRARNRIYQDLFQSWSPEEREQFEVLLSRFTADFVALDNSRVKQDAEKEG